MLDSGLVTIGAHTDSHLDLRNADPDAIREELNRSNALIDDRCHVSPRHFTYPWGRWSPNADAIVRVTYESATLGSGPAISPESDLHTLHRLPVQRSDLTPLLRWKLTAGGRSENYARRFLHRYHGP